MKVDIFLSTRNKSTRLPGKVLLQIKEKSITEHLIDRLRTVKNVSQIILCTSTNQDDNALVEIAKNNKIEFFRGSEEDKLERYRMAAEKFDTDFMIIVDGDDMLCEPSFMERCIKEFEDTGADYITVKDAPVGTVPFCIKAAALIKACRLKNQANTEIFESCFTDSGLFKVRYVTAQGKLKRPDIRLTLDYKEDFELIRTIFERLYSPGTIFGLEEIIGFLDKNPDLLKINQHCQRLFLENQKRLTKVTLQKET